MRHLGAGLAIPTFPQVTPGGGWLPKDHNLFIDLNFAHTRAGALVVVVAVVLLALQAFAKGANEPAIRRAALLLIALTVAQVAFGMFVVWQMRPPIVTTLHVVNGAALLAATVLLAVRAGHRSGEMRRAPRPLDSPDLQEARA